MPKKITYTAGVSLLHAIFYRMVSEPENNVHMNTYPEVHPQIVTNIIKRQFVPSHSEKETFRQHFVSRGDRRDPFEATGPHTLPDLILCEHI
jgi:hypothetical protein